MEHYEVIVYATAEADIQNAIRYISKTLREPGTAQTMLRRFQDAILSLGSMPKRFPIVRDSYLASFGIRTTSVGKYMIFYLVREGEHEVDILRVLYGKRNWTELLSGNKENTE